MSDLFAPEGDFWAVVDEPVAELRRRYAIPPLDPPLGATLSLLQS